MATPNIKMENDEQQEGVVEARLDISPTLIYRFKTFDMTLVIQQPQQAKQSPLFTTQTLSAELARLGTLRVVSASDHSIELRSCSACLRKLQKHNNKKNDASTPSPTGLLRLGSLVCPAPGVFVWKRCRGLCYSSRLHFGCREVAAVLRLPHPSSSPSLSSSPRFIEVVSNSFELRSRDNNNNSSRIKEEPTQQLLLPTSSAQQCMMSSSTSPSSSTSSPSPRTLQLTLLSHPTPLVREIDCHQVFCVVRIAFTVLDESTALSINASLTPAFKIFSEFLGNQMHMDRATRQVIGITFWRSKEMALISHNAIVNNVYQPNSRSTTLINAFHSWI